MPNSPLPPPVPDKATLDQAFTAVRSYKPGSSRGSLVPIDDAVLACLSQPSSRSPLEQRLSELLTQPLSSVAKEYLCSKLALIGTAASVPVLATLLTDKDLHEAARAALEAMPCPEALDALRAASRQSGPGRVGLINSLRARRDVQSVQELAGLLQDADSNVVLAAAAALGQMGTASAAGVLAAAHAKLSESVQQGVADARLVCADRLLASGHKAEALAIYKTLSEPGQPKPVQLAAKRGMLEVLQAK
jgi:HEAT repeat protein